MIRSLLQSLRYILPSLLAISLSGCTSVPMPKGNSKGYSTVRFVAPNRPLGNDDSPAFVEANRMIQTAIADQMEQHGLQVVNGNADLIIAHLIILQDNVSTSYSNQYFGTQDFSGLLNLAHKKGTEKHYPEKVQKRALVIDLIDARTYKLVYRNYIVSGVLANLSETERQSRIDAAVAETLQTFFR